MTVSAYAQLKKDVVTGVVTSAGSAFGKILSALKVHYKEKINSPRRLEQIKSLGDLITVLEIRDVLSEDNVEQLKVIAQSVENSIELIRKIDNYEESHVRREYANSYCYEHQHNSTNIQCTNPFGINLNPIKRQRMIEILIEEIGSSWRDLGRNLKVRECEIDEIDDKYNSVGKKTAEVLQTFEKRADSQRWFFTLCTALDKTRRGDLIKSLQEVMTMNI